METNSKTDNRTNYITHKIDTATEKMIKLNVSMPPFCEEESVIIHEVIDDLNTIKDYIKGKSK